MKLHLKAPFLALLVAGCSAPATVPDAPPTQTTPGPVHVKLLGINDFHGHLEGPSGKITVGEVTTEAGGVDYLAARIAEIAKYHPHTVVVGAGDMVGASPLISGLFHDEPAIETLNQAGLAISAVGNHEFDEGVDELMRLKKGGCHPKDGCVDGDPFEGAKFDMLAANVLYKNSGEPIFPAYVVREFEGVPVGFIGLTLEGTPEIVDPSGITGVDFKDEAETINAAAQALQADGVEAIVVLIHEGGLPASKDPNVCEGISGPILDIVQNSSKAVDIFVTGHTHQAYVCQVDGRLVTSAKSYGQMLTEIDVKLNRETRDVEAVQAKNHIVHRDGQGHPEVAATVEKYRTLVAPLANKQIGEIKGDILREAGPAGDSPLGRLIADIQLAATASQDKGAAQIAFMNSGGVRADLNFAPAGQEMPGAVTFAEAHTVQPFGNSLVTLTLTGAQLDELLESQFQADRTRILHPSSGFTYAWSEKAPIGAKVDPKSIKLNGKVVDPAATYRVTVNSFIAAGGDGYTVLPLGTERIGGPLDLDAFITYFETQSPIAAPAKSRITKLP